MTSDAIDVPAAVAALKALANPARLRIALHLLDGEKGVSEIEGELGLRQPNLSQHLAELREAGLVKTRREARNVFYALADARTKALLLALSSPSAAACGAEPSGPGRLRPRLPIAAAAFATVGTVR